MNTRKLISLLSIVLVLVLLAAGCEPTSGPAVQEVEVIVVATATPVQGCVDYAIDLECTNYDGIYIGEIGVIGSNGTNFPQVKGHGHYVGTAGQDGFHVKEAGEDGVSVEEAKGHGFYVGLAGSGDMEGRQDGFHVEQAKRHGLYVDRADDDGVHVLKASDDGFVVEEAGYWGVNVGTTGQDGVHVLSAGDNGVQVITATNNYFAGGPDGNYDFRVANTGQVRSDVGIAIPADFAELMETEEGTGIGYEPGDVLVISDARDRAVGLAREPYSTAVIGIYSESPGIRASDHPMDDMRPSEIPVAVVGIVRCKVSAENGPIHRGDLLTTSSTPGHAMRATELRLGSILGKALGELESGAGVIEVLVMLQ